MPPKGAKGGAGSKQKKGKEEEQREDTLQAVILADSFEKKFAPFTLERPRCLLPLANAPLIEYTLEFLANAGVEEIFMYCGAHTDQVEEYINASKWKLPSSPFKSLALVRSIAASVGDCMRDLDNRDYITGDFLLVTGDLVSNISLEPALAKHRARREKDKNAIMTMVLRVAGTEHRTKAQRQQPVFVIDPQKERCLHYEEMRRGKRGGGGHYVSIDPEILGAHSELEIRSDLIDCQVDICTPDVLSLWSDNFDYQSPRTSFLFGVLKDYELNGKTFHTHIVTEKYAARVRSLHAYDAISRDIIARWTYPLTPDCNIFRGQTYRLGKNKTYLEEGVVLAKGGKVAESSIVGSGTSIGDGSIVTNSVLGRGCRVGRNVTIRDSYIWDDAVVGNGSTVDRSIIANSALVGKECNVGPNCLLSYGVQISNRTTLTSGTRLTLAESAPAKSAAPPGTTAHVYDSSSDSDASAPSAGASPLFPAPALHPSLSTASLSSVSTLHSHASTDSLPATPLSGPSHHDRRPSAASYPSDALTQTLSASGGAAVSNHHHHHHGGTSSNGPAAVSFTAEAAASIYDGLAANEPADKIRLELVAQRLASDAADSAVRDALVLAFLRRVWVLIDGSNTNNNTNNNTASDDNSTTTTPAAAAATKLSPAAAVRAVFALDTYGWLLQKMGLFDGELAVKSDQVAVLAAVEKGCRRRLALKESGGGGGGGGGGGTGAVGGFGKEVLLFVAKEGWEAGWLEEEGILEWWGRGEGGDGEGGGKGDGKGEKEKDGKGDVRTLVGGFVKWLKEAEEEGSSDEEDEEEEEEDDDEEDEDVDVDEESE